jgi:hypothetical protein
MRGLILILFISTLAPALLAAENFTKEVYDLPQPVAIQPRKYSMNNSLLLTVGHIPTDSFNKGYSFTAGYRKALANYITWDVFSFSHIMNKETALKGDIQNLGITIKNVGLGGRLDYPRQIYMTGLHYAPMYSKSLVFNETLTYSETSLFLGTGTLNFNEIGHKPMIAPGLATRIYMGPNTALNGYFRYYFFMDDERGLTSIGDFGIGLEFKFGGDFVGGSYDDDDE